MLTEVSEVFDASVFRAVSNQLADKFPRASVSKAVSISKTSVRPRRQVIFILAAVRT